MCKFDKNQKKDDEELDCDFLRLLSIKHCQGSVEDKARALCEMAFPGIQANHEISYELFAILKDFNANLIEK